MSSIELFFINYFQCSKISITMPRNFFCLVLLFVHCVNQSQGNTTDDKSHGEYTRSASSHDFCLDFSSGICVHLS